MLVQPLQGDRCREFSSTLPYGVRAVCEGPATPAEINLECAACYEPVETQYWAFVTSAKYQPGTGFNGLDDADEICQADAEAAGLPGTYKAWLSDDDTSAADRLAQDAFPLLRTSDGETIADDWTDLTNGSLDVAIDADAYGHTLVSDEDVWTGTKPDGDKTQGGTCSSWTTTSGNGYTGISGDWTYAWTWTDASSISCYGSCRLYCFRQTR